MTGFMIPPKYPAVVCVVRVPSAVVGVSAVGVAGWLKA
jgi:hypothetical protein